MSQSTSQEPQIIDGRYRVVRQLGEGGMGVVVECVHTGTKRPFAVKVIQAAFAGRGAAVERFMREAEATGTIRSVHVVDISDVGIDRASGNTYMAMELLSGEDLGKHLETRGPVAPELALRIAAQALVGLSAAHKAGIVHRDIKPSNLFLARRPDNPLASGAVWVDGERVLKILDFGIAKLHAADTDPGSQKLTKTGGFVGSPSYMSPEQAAGRLDLDHRTDLWSLGAVLYEALSGTTPYQGAANLNQLILQISHGPPEPLSARAPGVPPEVAAIVTRALAHNRDHRFQTAEEMLAAVLPLIRGSTAITEGMLGAGAAGGPVSAVVTGPAAQNGSGGTVVFPGVPLSSATQAALGRTVEPNQSRRLAVIAAITVAVCAVVAALAVKLTPNRNVPVVVDGDDGGGGPPGSGPNDPAPGAITVSNSGVPVAWGTSGVVGALGAADSSDAGAASDAGTAGNAGSATAPGRSGQSSSGTGGNKGDSNFKPKREF